jgi:hypothetical protein
MSWNGSWTPPDWSMHEQTRGLIESDVKGKITNDIQEYIELCKKRGMSSHFISGLEVAADIVYFGNKDRRKQEETLF